MDICQILNLFILWFRHLCVTVLLYLFGVDNRTELRKKESSCWKIILISEHFKVVVLVLNLKYHVVSPRCNSRSEPQVQTSGGNHSGPASQLPWSAHGASAIWWDGWNTPLPDLIPWRGKYLLGMFPIFVLKGFLTTWPILLSLCCNSFWVFTGCCCCQQRPVPASWLHTYLFSGSSCFIYLKQ